MKLHAVHTKHARRLSDEDASCDPGESHAHIEKDTQKAAEKIAELQRVFYAEGNHSLLIVLQGRDASGKDGTIRKVFSVVNPQGCSVTSFKEPSDEEKAHDYLWRVHRAVPARGMIGIFNRSHYEDILVPRVHDLLPRKVWRARYDQINDFERMLTANGVVILKFLLHVSHDEQRKRLQERIDDPAKNWKFRRGDLDDRERWESFTKAYRGILENTSTRWAPWYVVPSDDKLVRDWLVARLIAKTLERLKLHYPPANESIRNLEVS